MSSHYHLQEIACLPDPSDNCAIALRRLQTGTELQAPDGSSFALDFTVLEGHRFAVSSIRKGEALLSWGMPCGILRANVNPGSYIYNTGVLAELGTRNIDFALPRKPNLEDFYEPYILNTQTFRPTKQIELSDRRRSFQGFTRSSKRGVGTRNYVVVLAASSAASGYVRRLTDDCKDLCSQLKNVDGIVAVAHTEGGSHFKPNNVDYVMRTLAGFMVHPNVGAVLVVDEPTGWVRNDLIRDFLTKNSYPVSDTPHTFLSLTQGFETSLVAGRKIIGDWLEKINSIQRTPQPLSALKIALQCGGSDSFSGVSANPLVGRLAKEVVRHGGSANLAETVELVGAEAYLLSAVSNLQTAERFLDFVEGFKQKMSWHGHSPESNPSGGNRFRGLYNISIKSLGAAMKKDPEVRLDFAIDYSEPMTEPGFYFMNSPGNDLESVAGQVASGANLILFTTGNGSITNFPFVPTLKVLSTTARYQMLENDIDVNAGAYLDGRSMDDLADSLLDLAIQTASGRYSKGENAQHSQVSIWRDWQQTGPVSPDISLSDPDTVGSPLKKKGPKKQPRRKLSFTGFRTPIGTTIDQVALIVPASLCSSQVAQMLALELNQNRPVPEEFVTRFVSFGHTEGCGATSGHSENLLVQTLLGYMNHPMVRFAMVLEHGCEKVHNEYLKGKLEESGHDPASFGWASIQLDGGIEKTRRRIRTWFAEFADTSAPNSVVKAGLESVRLGVLTAQPCPDGVSAVIAETVDDVIGSGGTVVIPSSDRLLKGSFLYDLGISRESTKATLSYGGYSKVAGLHLMDMPTDHWVELLSGLGASGVEMILAYTGHHPLQGHPLVPVIQVGSTDDQCLTSTDNFDLMASEDHETLLEDLYELLAKTASRSYVPKALRQGNVDFQMTRGPLGFSV